MIMLKVLTQYQEATGDARVIPVMEKYFAYQSRILTGEPLKDGPSIAGRTNWPACCGSTIATAIRSLLELARQLKGQGFDWRKLVRQLPIPRQGGARPGET